MTAALVRTQIRIPEAVYSAVRHVAASTGRSANAAILDLLSEALESHHDQLPTSISSALKGQRQVG